MQKIQSACVDLTAYQDSYVSDLAVKIANLDLKRDLAHTNIIVRLEASLSTAKAKLRVERAEIRRLGALNAKLNNMLFGQSSEAGHGKSDNDERLDSVTIPPEEDKSIQGDTPSETDLHHKKPRGMRGRQAVEIPDHLLRDYRKIKPKNGPMCDCGCEMRCIGEETIERLTYKPAEVRVIAETYPKYTCRTCDRFIQAPVPKRAFDYTKFDDQMIAGLAVAKFADFLPNYRQEEIFKRVGVQFHRSTMGRLMTKAVDALEPVHDALAVNLKSSTKLFMDETRLPQLLPGNGKTKTCWIWGMCRDDRRWLGNAPPGVAFYFDQTRKGEVPETLLQGFDGILQVDGYQAYKRLMSGKRRGAPINLAYCWAHVRRKFVDVYKATKSEKANEIVGLINKLYGIERELKGQPVEARWMVRQKESNPLVIKLFSRLHILLGQISTKSTLAEAIRYTFKLENGLCVFLSDGRVEIDNNPVENTIRPIALLRKNALFAGSEVGGKTWAVMASLIGTCKLNGVEPYAYLTWVFEQMANGHPRSEYEKLLPWHCPKGRFGIE